MQTRSSTRASSGERRMSVPESAAPRRSRSFSRSVVEVRGPNLCEPSGSRDHPSKHLERAAFMKRLVEVAALGRLHARRAPGLAGALVDEPVRVRRQDVELAEALARDAHA